MSDSKQGDFGCGDLFASSSQIHPGQEITWHFFSPHFLCSLTKTIWLCWSPLKSFHKHTGQSNDLKKPPRTISEEKLWIEFYCLFVRQNVYGGQWSQADIVHVQLCMHQLMWLHKCWCKCKYTKAYANICKYMWVCKHYANTCKYMNYASIMQIHAHNIACTFANSMQLHANMRIYAWMRISRLAYGGNRGRLHYIKVKLAMYITASLI